MPAHHSLAQETEPLDHRKLQALVALLHNASVTKAAAAVGVDRATLYRWARQPAFQKALRDARAHIQSQTLAHLQVGAEPASALLSATAQDRQAPIVARVRAAQAVLEEAAKTFGRSAIDRRLAGVEQALRAIQAKTT